MKPALTRARELNATSLDQFPGDPDFILMSGDIVHFPQRNSSDLTPELILYTIEQVTAWVIKTFPNTKLYGAHRGKVYRSHGGNVLKKSITQLEIDVYRNHIFALFHDFSRHRRLFTRVARPSLTKNAPT